MKFYKINDKLVKASSLQNAIGLVKDAAIKTEYSYKGYKIIYAYGSFTIYSGYDEIAGGFYSVNEAKEYINNYVIKRRK